MNLLRLVLILLGTIWLSNCNQTNKNNPFNELTDDELKIIMIKALNQAGGLEKWHQVVSFSFVKRAVFYLPEGGLDIELIQKQYFQIKPSFKAMFEWELAGDQISLYYENGEATKLVNGNKEPSGAFDIEQVLGDYLVSTIPFNLLENAINLEMIGEIDYDNRHTVVIKSIRHALNPNNVWWYFFDEETGEYLASTIHHSPTFAHIKNENFLTMGGLKFPAHRQSYRTDSLGNIEYLRAEFFYTDYKVNFK